MVTASVGEWVLLSYRLPRDPSTPRIGVWRKLQRLGVAQLSDGLVALPLDARAREQLEWIADEVVGHGGEATIWVGSPASASDERAIATRMASAISTQYEAVIAEADQAELLDESARRRRLARLRRELRRIRSRDYFPTADRETATKAVDGLARATESV